MRERERGTRDNGEERESTPREGKVRATETGSSLRERLQIELDGHTTRWMSGEDERARDSG